MGPGPGKHVVGAVTAQGFDRDPAGPDPGLRVVGGTGGVAAPRIMLVTSVSK